MLSPTVRAMSPLDAMDVARIYAEGIETGHATCESEPPEWPVFDATHLQECRLVAVAGAETVGWAALSPTSSRCAYRGVAEVSVYVAASARGKGVGLALMSALLDDSERAGIWTLVAGVFPENAASLALHHKVGFRTVGTRERVVQTAGAWRDVVLLERRSATVGT